MKTVVLVHGWGGSPKKDWFEWADVEIKKLGYNVVCPEMPETDEPKISLWVDKLNEILKKTEGKIILVGHSIGCQTILRTLAGGDIKSTIYKIILVAPWWFLTVGEEEDIIAKPWYDQNIDFNSLAEIPMPFKAGDECLPATKQGVNLAKWRYKCHYSFCGRV